MDSNMNATKHGCCALEVLILPNETEEDFKLLEEAWFETYNPQTETETNLVDQLVANDWLLTRSIKKLAEVESKIYAAEPDPLAWTDHHHKTLTRFQRYRTANQNVVAKCRKAIEEHRKNRASEVQKTEKHEMVKERFKIYQRKNKPKPTWDETLADMKAEAIRLGYAPDPNAQKPQTSKDGD